MFKKQKIKSKSGITLVTLVVTIVVLLLLNGYYYVGGTKNTWLVISDESSDENKYKTAEDGKVLKDDLVGNQWVWVPVEKISKYCESVDSGESMFGSVGVTTKLYTKTATIGRTGDTATIKRVKPGNTSSYREPDLIVGSNGTSYDAANYKTIVGNNGTLKEMAELFKNEYETMR